MRRLLRTRTRKVVAVVVVLALISAGIAAAAIFGLFTGATGSSNGTYGAAQAQNALTLTGASQPVIVGPSDSKPLVMNAVNADTVNAHTLNTLVATFTTNPVQCASHMSANVASLIGAVFAASFNGSPGSISILSDATTPVACASGTWSVAFAGTTTP